MVCDLSTSKENSGLQLIQQARKRGIPSIIMSKNFEKASVIEATNLGAEYILEKPFPPMQLQNALMEIWENPSGLIGLRERCFDLHQLTEKEKEFSRIILKGFSNKDIARILDTTVATVKFYSNQIYGKCQISSRAELFNLIFPT